MNTDLHFLIVDDEELARKDIAAKLLSFGYTHIQESNNGFQALALIEESLPDVIIADIRMPGMDGLSLLKEIRNRGLDILYILLSGYEVFDYAKEAIKYGAAYYLLKPIDEAEFQQVLQQAEASLAQKKHSEKLKADYDKRLHYSQKQEQISKLEQLVFKQLPDEEARKLCSFLGFSSLHFAVVVLLASTELSSHPLGDEALFYFCAENIAQEVLTKYGIRCLGLPTRKEFCLICNLPDKHPSSFAESKTFSFHSAEQSTVSSFFPSKENTFCHSTDQPEASFLPKSTADIPVLSALEEAISACSFTLSIRLSSGIRFAENPGQLSLAFEAACADAYEKLSGANTHDASNPLPVALSTKQETSLLSALEQGKEAAIADSLQEIYYQFFHQAFLDKNALNHLNLQLILFFQRFLKEQNLDAEALLGSEFDLYKEAGELSNERKTLDWMVKKALTCANAVKSLPAEAPDEKHFFSRIQSYLQLHYAEELTLEQVAETFHFSASHFSRLFRKYFRESFVKYLNDLRIAEAKQLLVSTDTKVFEIGKQVGFQDSRYFYKVFKKLTGFQPSAYREHFKKL